jgi:hypothetical protein
MSGDPEAKPELLFGVAEMAWSRDYFDSMVSALEREGFSIVMEHAPRADLPVSRWLSVTLRDSAPDLPARAHALVLSAFRSLGVPESGTFRVRYRGTIGSQAWARLRESRKGSA